MLRTLLTLRLLISFFRMFPLLFIGLAAFLYTGLKQVTDQIPDGYWEKDKTPMLHLKSVDDERIRNGLPLIR
jgi:hypothetical protein